MERDERRKARKIKSGDEGESLNKSYDMIRKEQKG